MHSAHHTRVAAAQCATMQTMNSSRTEERIDDLDRKVDELRDEMREGFKEMRAGFEEMRTEFKAVRKEMSAEFKAVRAEIKAESRVLRDEMNLRLEGVHRSMTAIWASIASGYVAALAALIVTQL